jgi:acyl-CoA synthetase (AMP-forming)/AMP-acid ligase II
VTERASSLERLSADRAPHAAVAVRGSRVILESEFRARVRAWRGALVAARVREIALFHRDGVEFAAALYGAWHAGIAVWIPGDDLGATRRALRTRVARFAGEFPADCAPVMAGTDAPDVPLAPLDARAEAVVLFTSGSTGEPQAYPKRLSQLAAEVGTLDRTFGTSLGTAEIVATVSHQHIYGLLFKILWPLTSGRVFCARSLVYPEELEEAMAGRRVALIANPAHLERLERPARQQIGRGTVCAVFSSGGPLAPEGVRRSEASFGCTPLEIYGSTETGGVAWRESPGGVPAAWTPFDDVELRDADGALAVRSPKVRDAAWWTTEDLARFDAAGHFTLLGRRDRIVKVFGVRTSLAGMERALSESPYVASARVLAPEDGASRLAAVVVPSAAGAAELARNGPRALAHRLRMALEDVADPVALPRRWRFVPALPVNREGKTTIAALARLFPPARRELPIVRARERDATTARLTLDVPADLIHFEGHFPGRPVLPGIVLVDWAIQYGCREVGCDGEFRALERVKFHRVVPPETALRLTLDWRAAERVLEFAYESSAGPHASGRVRFGG